MHNNNHGFYVQLKVQSFQLTIFSIWLQTSELDTMNVSLQLQLSAINKLGGIAGGEVLGIVAFIAVPNRGLCSLVQGNPGNNELVDVLCE